MDNEGMGKKSSKGMYSSTHAFHQVQNETGSRIVGQVLISGQSAAYTTLSAKSASLPTTHLAIPAVTLIRTAM